MGGGKQEWVKFIHVDFDQILEELNLRLKLNHCQLSQMLGSGGRTLGGGGSLCTPPVLIPETSSESHFLIFCRYCSGLLEYHSLYYAFCLQI